MKFEPKSEADIARDGLLPKGEYDFEVVGAEEKISSKGNPMIEINLRIFRPDGGTSFLRDYLMEKIAYKLRHFCEATGLLKKYESGDLMAEDCEMKVGKCKLVIKEDKAGQYPPQNSVADYIVPGKEEDKDEDQEMPF